MTDDLRSKIKTAQSAALLSSALGKACQYALALWKKLTRFLEYPALELSTNLAENSMRPRALGRKNQLHIGSPHAGSKVAAIRSVVESCRRLQLSVRDYLAAILPGPPISRSSASRNSPRLRGPCNADRPQSQWNGTLSALLLYVERALETPSLPGPPTKKLEVMHEVVNDLHRKLGSGGSERK